MICSHWLAQTVNDVGPNTFGMGEDLIRILVTSMVSMSRGRFTMNAVLLLGISECSVSSGSNVQLIKRTCSELRGPARAAQQDKEIRREWIQQEERWTVEQGDMLEGVWQVQGKEVAWMVRAAH